MTVNKPHKGFRSRPTMNVTPLVDVVLVLLIIFMVVIPAMEQGMAIEIPGIRNVDPKKEGSAQPFTMSINKNGEIFFEEEDLPMDKVEGRLRAAARKEPGRRIVLRGDRSAPYGTVRKLYRIAQEVGFPGVSLKVNQRQADGPATAQAAR